MEKLTAAVNDLIVSVASLTNRLDVYQEVLERIDQQSQDIEQQRQGLHLTRVILSVAIVAIVLSLGLSVGGVYLYRQVETNQRQSETNQQQIAAVQQRTSTEILCPLYTVFATSIKINPPNPNLTPEQANARQAAADTILAGLNKLGCV